MRSLGDDYVKSEFKRHKAAENPVHVMGFLLEWNKYLDTLEAKFGEDLDGDPSNGRESFRGKKMDDTLFDTVRSKLNVLL